MVEGSDRPQSPQIGHPDTKFRKDATIYRKV